MSARQLTEDETAMALEMYTMGERLKTIAEKLNFKDLMEFFRYRQRNPCFDKLLLNTRAQGNELMEEEIRFAAEDFHNPHTARIKVDALNRLLKFRDPAKYGDKVDINLNQTVDISQSLARMQTRLAGAYDVTPSAIEGTIEKPNDSEGLW